MFIRILIIAVSAVGLLLSFQNCSSAEFSQSSDSEASLLSEVPEPDFTDPEIECVTGKKLTIWSDLDSDGSTVGENALGEVVAYNGAIDAATNYNYYSASAHPTIGPTPRGFESHVYFYDGPEGLSLNFYHNVDADGSEENIVNWDIYTSGNSSKDYLILSDDPNEVKLASSNSVENYYQAYLHYWKNTDGAVIGPFEGTDFKIRVKVSGVGDMQDAVFYSANGDVYSLKNKGVIDSFIISYQTYETCE